MKIRPFTPVLFLLIWLSVSCKQAQTTHQQNAKAMNESSVIQTESDFKYLAEYDFKKFNEGVADAPAFTNRLKKLLKDYYSAVITPMEKGNPEGILSDGLWYTLFAEYEVKGIRYQSTIVADLTTNTLCAGFWDSKSDKVVSFAEDPSKISPPYQAWLDDSD